MTDSDTPVNNAAPLANVGEAYKAMESALERDPDMPGMLCLFGNSGLGKSKAAVYLMMKHRAYYIQVQSLWTRKAFLQSILQEMGIQPATTMSDMAQQVTQQLMQSGRPLIIDEADYLVDRGKSYVSMLMDIYEGSAAPVMIVGEELLPQKLERHYEKIHNRMLHWVEAKPCNLRDCRLLADMYAKDIKVADDLLEHINKEVAGITRRVAVNLNLVRRAATKEKLTDVDLAWWGDRELHEGQAPRRSRR